MYASQLARLGQRWNSLNWRRKAWGKGCRDTAASQLRISYELLENKNPIDKLTRY